MKVILSNEAKQDMNSIFEYIARDSLKYAIETDANIRLSIHKLEDSPYLGRYVQEFSDKHYRELLYKNYRIFYEFFPETEIIYIHFVIHSKRNFKSFYKSYIKNNF